MIEQLIDDLFSRAAHERVVVMSLTDEELTVLDGPETEQIALRPWFDRQDEATRETILHVALRGLIARGIAAPERVNADGDVVLQVADDLRAVLAARQAASFLVLAGRAGEEMAQSRVVYGRPGDVAVEEDVSEGGLHALSAAPVAELAARLAAFCDPANSAAERVTAAPRTMELAELTSGAGQDVFAHSHTVTQLSRITLDGDDEPAEERLSVYATAGQVFVAEADEGGTLTLAEHDAAGLRERLLRLLRP